MLCKGALSQLFRENFIRSELQFVIHFCHTKVQNQKTMKKAHIQEGSNVKIGTHNGVFHCDEVLACYLLKRLPQYKHAEVVRTRDQQLLDLCDIVVDVGGSYDPSKHQYDHHQRSFNESMHTLSPEFPWKTKLSSAGLVYFHFGKDVLKTYVEGDEELLTEVYKQVYEHFIQEIDGIDNGVPMFDGEPSYRITTNLSSRVSYLNPSWNSTEDYDETALFNKAMQLVGDEFNDRINYVSKVWWQARHIVEKVIENRFSVHPSGNIIEFPEGQVCPWKEHLFALEGKFNIKSTIKFVLFADNNKNWRVQAVPIGIGSFVCRQVLLEEWQGLRNEDLSKTCGIDGCIFVHATGFIGGNKSREGAFQMAVKCLEHGHAKEIKC